MGRFIAALDQSGGSTGAALYRYGVEYTDDDMMDKMHAFRLRMIANPDFNRMNIWGAILFEDTVKRGLVDTLDGMNIESFLKVDRGLNQDGTMKQFPIKQILSNTPKCLYGTKMRSVVHSVDMVDTVLNQQFSIARAIADRGLVPIIEPEVSIDNPDKKEIELYLYNRLEEHLTGDQFTCILKLTLPTVTDLYHNLTVNSNVRKVVFLSGGYSLDTACDLLSQNRNSMASFSRALTEGLQYNQTTEEFNNILSSNIKKIKNS